MSDGRGDFRPLNNFEIDNDADDAFDDEEMEYGYYERRRKGYGAMRTASRQRCSWMSILGMCILLLAAVVVVLRVLPAGSPNLTKSNDNNLEDQQQQQEQPGNTPPTHDPEENNSNKNNNIEQPTDPPTPVMHCGGGIDVSGTSWSNFKQIEESKTEWCRPKFKHCDCSNPSKEMPYLEQDWKNAFERNKQLVHDESEYDRPLDMVFLGGVEVEQWLGTKVGEPSPELADNKYIYEQLFRNDEALVHGLFLGIGGDTCSQLLYRINNGEIPDDDSSSSSFQPSQWWINIGTGDLFRDKCTPEAILACIMEVVESIQTMRPNSHIVLHSVTPRGYDDIEHNQFMAEIIPLNHLIECYASSRENVSWFDATNLFLTSDHTKINSTLFDADFLHVSGEG